MNGSGGAAAVSAVDRDAHVARELHDLLSLCTHIVRTGEHLFERTIGARRVASNADAHFLRTLRSAKGGGGAGGAAGGCFGGGVSSMVGGEGGGGGSSVGGSVGAVESDGVADADFQGLSGSDDSDDGDAFYDALDTSDASPASVYPHAGGGTEPMGGGAKAAVVQLPLSTAAAGAGAGGGLARVASGASATTVAVAAVATAAGVVTAATAAAGRAVAGGDPTAVVLAAAPSRPEDDMLYPVPWRRSLPAREPAAKPSIWSVLKGSVGKDLSKISLPVVFNEPLSLLQRLAEDLQYRQLLDAAAIEPDPLRRLLLVTVMACSMYSSTHDRLAKPFNPLLGETFELFLPGGADGVPPGGGWTAGAATDDAADRLDPRLSAPSANPVRFLAEQVSHHPPVSACYADGGPRASPWLYYRSTAVLNKFWGKSLEIIPTGITHVELPTVGDHYAWQPVTTCVHNIVVGRMWLDNYGELVITERSSGAVARVKLAKTGWMADARSLGALSGTVFDAAGTPRHRLAGHWTRSIWEVLPGGRRRTLWRAAARVDATAAAGYTLTPFSLMLNAPLPAGAPSAPTDTRRRGDQRALEEGALSAAAAAKGALEDRQRAARRARAAAAAAAAVNNGESAAAAADDGWTPRWFARGPDRAADPAGDWRFTGDFFRARRAGDWAGCADIYVLPPGGATDGRGGRRGLSSASAASSSSSTGM